MVGRCHPHGREQKPGARRDGSISAIYSDVTDAWERACPVVGAISDRLSDLADLVPAGLWCDRWSHPPGVLATAGECDDECALRDTSHLHPHRRRPAGMLSPYVNPASCHEPSK